MRKILTYLLVLLSTVCFAQSETHDFVTTEHQLTVGSDKWLIRASYPANMNTPNHPDTSSRPVIIMMPGLGESEFNSDGTRKDSSQLSAGAKRYGPHYWMLNGWDGGIQLGNGKHYPIIITVVPNYPNPRAPQVLTVLNHILSTYRIKGNSVHLTGLSMGAFTWSKAIVYEASAGAETFMKLIKSICLLQGASNETFAPYNAWTRGWGAFGRWAKIYDGRYLGLEGTADTRNNWQIRNAMRDSGYVSNGYFAWETIGNGFHCCWNTMYDPGRTNWSAIPPYGDNITTNNNAGKDNTQGTYKPGTNLFTWMYQQGDTSLVGGAPGSPIANAGEDQTINLPTTSANLVGTNTGSAATSTAWTQTSGTSATITSPTSLSTSITGLSTVGVRTFRLTLTNAQGTSTDDITINVMGGVNTDPTVNAGDDQTLTLPTQNTSVTAIASDVDGTIVSYQWTSQSSGVTFGSATSATTTVSNLPVGTTILQILVTDDDGAIALDEVAITVVDPNVQTANRVKVRLGGAGTPDEPGWVTTIIPSGSQNVPLNITAFNEDGTASSIRISLTNTYQTYDNGANYLAWSDAAIGPQWPRDVLRRGTYYAGARVMTITGMRPGIPYNIYLLGSRSSGPTNKIRFSIQGNSSPDIIPYNNNDSTAIFTGYTSSDGSMVVSITPTGTGYFNGFIIEEQGASAPVNTAPVVNVASVAPISLPANSVSLSATASDEDQAGLTYLWSILSGPQGGTFSAETSLTTNLSGLTQGTYTIQFAATDTGGLTGLGTIQVVVNPAGNILPVVNAGPDQILTLPDGVSSISTSLTGSATDADGTITAYQWSFISGPSGSNLVNTTQPTASVSGLVIGQYFFRLQATDNNGGFRTDTVSVIIVPQQTERVIKTIVGAGEYQAYFIDSIKQLWSIGNVTNGGSGNVGQAPVPRRVTGAAASVQFDTTVGALHGGAAIDVNGYVWVLGDNDQAQHGQGNFIHPIYVAQQILIDSSGAPFNNVKQITGGYLFARQSNYFMAIKHDGTLWGWGKMLGGLIGNGTDSVTYFCTRPYQIHIPGNRLVIKIIAGDNPMALCSDGTVWTWGYVGNYANLGYVPTNAATDYRTPHQVTFGSITDPVVEIAGGGGWNYALFGNGTLYGWGFYGNGMGDLAFPTGNGTVYSTPRQLTNITSNLPAKIVKIVANRGATYALLENGFLMGWGDNAMSLLANGGSLDWANTPTPWAWSGVYGQLLVKQPVRIGPGILFADIYTSNVYCYYFYAIDRNNQVYFGGRGKGDVAATGIGQCSPTQAAQRQDAIDHKWLKPVWPFSVTTQYLATSPDCVNGQTIGSPCTTCTAPSTTKPTANAGPNQTIPRNFTTLNGTGSTAPSGTTLGWVEWKQVSGPNTAQINLPGGFTPEISGLVDGVYTFRFIVEASNRQKDSTTMTVTVGQVANFPPSVFAGGSVVTQLPKDSVQLTASASDTPPGTIVSYNWTQVSAPLGGSATIVSPTLASTKVKFLKEGTYVFNVTVVDDGGLSASSQVTVIVSPAVQEPPVVTPNAPRKYFLLNGRKKP